MEINLDQLRRHSREITFAAIAVALVIAGSLYFHSHRAKKAKAESVPVQADVSQANQSDASSHSSAINSPQTSKPAADAATSLPAVATAVPRVFIHMNGSSNVALAKAIQKDLKAQGFFVPSPDSIPPLSKRMAAARLHYYSDDVYSRADLMKIQAVFTTEKLPILSTLIPNPPPPLQPARTYALYLGNK